jgi:hypothetical protein
MDDPMDDDIGWDFGLWLGDEPLEPVEPLEVQAEAVSATAASAAPAPSKVGRTFMWSSVDIDGVRLCTVHVLVRHVAAHRFWPVSLVTCS